MIEQTIQENHTLLQEDFIREFLSGDRNAILELAEKFMQANNLEFNKKYPKASIGDKWIPEYIALSENGWGMSTTDAIRCLLDIERTTQLVKGIKAATDDLRSRFPSDQPLRAIDAGCGSGITPAALALAGIDEVVGIDINPDTVNMAQKFIAAIGLSDTVNIQYADATQYKPKGLFHLLFSENLSTGCLYEPQVQIHNYLIQYLAEEGIVIPKAVTISMCPITVNWEHPELQKMMDGRKSIAFPRLPKESILSTEGEKTEVAILFANGTSAPEQIKAILKIPGNDQSLLPPNAILFRMDVKVYEEISIPGGTAQFLGVPEVAPASYQTPKGSKKLAKAQVVYKAGGNPPKEMKPIVG